jgi:murein DD-endopeptidase MepM/ murein hydrolase activator NlpD
MIITHTNGWKTLYWHLGAPLVANGAAVAAGQGIATVRPNVFSGSQGQCGYSDAPYQHVSFFQNGVAANMSGRSFGRYSVSSNGVNYGGSWRNNATGATLNVMGMSGRLARFE